MGKATDVVAHFDNVIKVTHTEGGTTPDYNRVAFTYLKSMRTFVGRRYVTLRDTEQLINNYDYKGDKKESPAFLKGIFEGYYRMEHITQNVPYLFFDIDVKQKSKGDKKDENTNLASTCNNEAVFNELKKIAVLVWRSHSGTGIAGILHVPQLEDYLFPENDIHKEVGEAITDHLSRLIIKKVGIPVKFDNAQSALRHLRYVAIQKVKRTLNLNPYCFSYTITKKQRMLTSGIPQYRMLNSTALSGSIFEQFNQNNNILDVLLSNNFEQVKVNRNRVKYINSDSDTSGIVHADKNTYLNFSGSFGDARKHYNPSQIVAKERFNDNWSDFAKYLRQQGYEDKQPSQNVITTAKNALKEALPIAKKEADIQKAIFKNVHSLRLLSDADKRKFVNEVCTEPSHKKYYNAYLKLYDTRLNFDATYTIENYVSEQLEQVLNYSDQHKKVAIQAETGTGKTTSFLKDFHTLRPNARILFLVPLTVIIEQNRKEYQEQGFKGVFLDGSSTNLDHVEALSNGFVFATYEQGAKVLEKTDFDYIVIDEVHQTLLANSYKYSAISDITYRIENSNAVRIGLTGTANNIFKNIGYKLLQVKRKEQEPTKINVVYSNIQAYSIALSHILNTNVKGKAIIRLNEIKTLNLLKKDAVQSGRYKANEVLILHSDTDIKKGADYKQLAHHRKFSDKIKLVLTTSLIDEGVSINQKGFTDVVFIETNYNPRPEPIKQFFARFRNIDANRKNYLYLKTKDNQSYSSFRPDWMYNSTYKDLKDEVNTFDAVDIKATYKVPFSNENLYYEDGSINKYYLADNVTNSYFSFVNKEQFLIHLEGYNIKVNVIENNHIAKYDKESNKEIKTVIAQYWINKTDEVLQIIKLKTQSNSIKKAISKKQTAITPETTAFCSSYMKDFESLYIKYHEAKSYGVDDPNTIVLYEDAKYGTLPTSDHNYNRWKLEQDLYRIVIHPKTKRDEITKSKIIDFVNWCKDKQEFTNAQMQKKINKLRLYDKRRLTKQTLFYVLEMFDLDVKECTKTKLITIS